MPKNLFKYHYHLRFNNCIIQNYTFLFKSNKYWDLEDWFYFLQICLHPLISQSSLFSDPDSISQFDLTWTDDRVMHPKHRTVSNCSSDYLMTPRCNIIIWYNYWIIILIMLPECFQGLKGFVIIVQVSSLRVYLQTETILWLLSRDSNFIGQIGDIYYFRNVHAFSVVKRL